MVASRPAQTVVVKMTLEEAQIVRCILRAAVVFADSTRAVDEQVKDGRWKLATVMDHLSHSIDDVVSP